MDTNPPANEFSDDLWELLESVGGKEEALRATLSKLSRESLVSLYKEFYRAMRTLWDKFDTSGYFDLAPIAGEQVSEDGKQDIFSFVVSQGREYYNYISDHPEQLRTDVDPDDVPFVWVPGEVFWVRFGNEITEQQA